MALDKEELVTAVAVEALDEFLMSQEFMENPYPTLHRLPEEDPVHWSNSIGGWILTRYDDIVATFKDVSRYSSEGRLAKAIAYLPPVIGYQMEAGIEGAAPQGQAGENHDNRLSAAGG